MRALVATLILFSLLVGVIVTNALYVNSVCDRLDITAEALKSSSSKERLISDLRATWNKSRSLLGFSIRASKIERMGDLIESLSASYEAQNDAEFQKYCILISELAKELARYEKLSLNSIC